MERSRPLTLYLCGGTSIDNSRAGQHRVRRHDIMKPLNRYSEAALPTKRGDFHLVVYRTEDRPDDEHIAMVYGDVRGQEDILCRVHSECLTGEVFGSLRCDCRQQLDVALERITG